MFIAQVTQKMCIVDTGAPVRDFDMAPSFERRESHEQVGDAGAAILIVISRWPPRGHAHRRARFVDELIVGLI